MAKSLREAYEYYKTFKDKAHGLEHIITVRENALSIANHYPELNEKDVRYAAVLHDIGHEFARLIDKDNHEEIGVSMAYRYIKNFPPERRKNIEEAIKEHRSSKGNPKCLLAKIIADADKLPKDIPSRIRRPYDYRISRGYSKEDALEYAFEYIHTELIKKLSIDRMYTPEGKEMMRSFNINLKELIPTIEQYRIIINE